MHIHLPDATLFDTYLSDRLQGPIGDDLPTPGLSLRYAATGLPVICRICDKGDKWLPENERVFVCEHDPLEGMPGLRVIDSVRSELVYIERGN